MEVLGGGKEREAESDEMGNGWKKREKKLQTEKDMLADGLGIRGMGTVRYHLGTGRRRSVAS